MNLLIDIGNTRIKWGIAANGHILTGSPLLAGQTDRQGLADAWKNISRPVRIAMSCVNAAAISETVRASALEFWPDADIIQVNTQAQGFGVYNAYLNPEKLGVDRWLALVAVRNLYQQPACIVDCGTAITVDLIDEKGRHLGGMICPGLTMMKKSLSEGTERLIFDQERHHTGPATSTEAAIYSGTLTAVIGLIEHVVSEQPKNSLLILTGGDAQLVASQLVDKAIVDADLVLRGLAIVLEGYI